MLSLLVNFNFYDNNHISFDAISEVGSYGPNNLNVKNKFPESFGGLILFRREIVSESLVSSILRNIGYYAFYGHFKELSIS